MKVEATSVTNLVRAADSGVYYVRVKILGKVVWRSLDTTTFSVAKLRLPDEVKKLRDAARVEVKIEPKTTFGQAADIYAITVNDTPRLKPRAKDFRLRSRLTLKRTWPNLFETELRKVTPEACKTWLSTFENGGSKYRPPKAKGDMRPGNSPTTVNAAIAFLRHVFEIGVKGGILYQNPAMQLAKKKPSRKFLRLPSKTQFAKMVALVRSTPGWGRKAGDLIEGLAYSGARVGEIRALTWGHLDLEKGMMAIPGEKTDSAPRVVPMTLKFKELILKMKEGKTPSHEEPVFEVSEASESLAGACRKIGTPHMTHHDLRHLFATTCIESGVDIPTVSRWLGHSDGGALAMRTYGHLRPEHSIEAAKKVVFD
jgi:integrase